MDSHHHATSRAPVVAVGTWSADHAHRNSSLTLIEIPHPCGSADEGGSASRLAVCDHWPAVEGDPLSLAHMGRRRGSTCTTQEGLVDLGDRPTHRAGPQDGPGLSER